MIQSHILSRRITSTVFQRQIYTELLDFLKLIRIVETSGDRFEKREPADLLRYYESIELIAEVNSQLDTVRKDFETLHDMCEKLKQLIGEISINERNALNLLDAYLDFSKVRSDYQTKTSVMHELNHQLQLKADRRYIYVEGKPDDILRFEQEIQDAIEDHSNNKIYLASIMAICKSARRHERDFTQEEWHGIWLAYSLLNKGTALDFGYSGIGTSGFRQNRHTYIFSTDPGDDHIRITARNSTLLDGVAVHVEHIDRDKVSDKSKVEAYRLPAAIHAQKVRLHIADEAPVTAYIGRPVFENGYDDIQKLGYISPGHYQMDKLKSVHMTASACTTMFQNGFADCKVAIERMPVTLAIAFMKSVVGNVIRDSTKQTLAAAFNINTPIFDDLNTNQLITDKLQIAKLGIEIAAKSGFDRVTWDGASNKVPSDAIIDQLTHEQFVELVHTAHEKGLQTYFSSGLSVEHIDRCIVTGVDGLGIGFSLHYMDPQTKLVGAFNPKAIEEVLRKRNEAEQSTLGQGARMLARMDRLYFEGNLLENEESVRQELYVAVLRKDEASVLSITNGQATSRIRSLPDEVGGVLLGRAVRTIHYLDSKGIRTEDDQLLYTELQEGLTDKDVKRLQHLFERRI